MIILCAVKVPSDPPLILRFEKRKMSSPYKNPFADTVSLESQQPSQPPQRGFFYRLYHTPYSQLSAWEIALRLGIAFFIGAVIGAIVGVIIHYA